MNWFIIASIPAAFIGIWNLGRESLLRLEGQVDLGWRALLLPAAAEPGSAQGALTGLSAEFGLGLSYVVPLLVVTLLASAFWARTFARLRRQPVDPGWVMSAWLFVLLLPPAATPLVAALGISFGLVVGMYVFGGTGRYLVSPALLGVLFVQFSYPEFGRSALPVENLLSPDWQLVVAEGLREPYLHRLMMGSAGAIGSSSILACLAGGLLLIHLRIVAWRVLAGAVLGLAGTALLIGAVQEDPLVLPWYWHLALGNFAFVLVFLATDPSTAPLTRQGRWVFGILIGGLTVLIRMLDPAHPDGALFALLLASLALPLVDHFVVQGFVRQSKRVQSRIGEQA